MRTGRKRKSDHTALKSANADTRLREARRPKGLRPSAAWIRARVALTRQIQREVRARLGEDPADVKLYRRRLERELRGSWEAATKSQLLDEVERADIVYGADFHAHGQSQRTHLKILRALPAERPVILALECVARSAQKYLDQYLAGHLPIEELPRRLKWEETWGFPWENYKPLLELARRRGFRLLALNEPRRAHLGLERRERSAAAALATARRREPGALIYVIFGGLHLASRHLPRFVRATTAAPPREVTIHLNSERLYFELARQGLELAVDVVRLRAGRYCILSAPPWVQWQSFLLYLERSEDAVVFDDDDYDEDDDDDDDGDDFAFDPTDHVATLIHLAARDLGVHVKVDDLAVYGADDAHVWEHLQRTLKPADHAIARQLLAGGRSFYLPQTGTGYLAQPTINHAATIAGQYLHAQLSGRKRSLWNMPRDFSALIWSEACAYFVSKMINHKRQSETLGDLRAQLALAGEADRGREAMRLALDRFMSELILIHQGRLRAPKFRPRQKSSYFEAARILGGMMGERLYMAQRSHMLEGRKIVRWLRRTTHASGFEKAYNEILRFLNDVETDRDAGGSTRLRRERL